MPFARRASAYDWLFRLPAEDDKQSQPDAPTPRSLSHAKHQPAVLTLQAQAGCLPRLARLPRGGHEPRRRRPLGRRWPGGRRMLGV